MSDFNKVSLQAFLQEIANWQLTLLRQCKKLKQLRKSTANKFQINSIDIAIIEIQSELIKYKKTKDKKYADSQLIVEEYTLLSRRFMSIMEKIGEAAEEDYHNDTLILDNHASLVEQNTAQKKKKHFLEQTFSHKVSKETSKKKAKSCMESKKKMREVFKDKVTSKNNINDRPMSILNKSKQNMSNLNKLQAEEEQDLWDIRYQLREIKSMMVQMDNEIKYHNHEDIERQIDKIDHNNKKLALELKHLKDDNQFVLARLQNIKQEINHEKKAQGEIIKQLQQSRGQKNSFHELSRSKQPPQQLSDWVRVRI